eukprot:1766785-Pleurochrysis_carterae.AAC.1
MLPSKLSLNKARGWFQACIEYITLFLPSLFASCILASPACPLSWIVYYFLRTLLDAVTARLAKRMQFRLFLGKAKGVLEK